MFFSEVVLKVDNPSENMKSVSVTAPYFNVFLRYQISVSFSNNTSLVFLVAGGQWELGGTFLSLIKTLQL